MTKWIIMRDLKEFWRNNISTLFLQKKGVQLLYQGFPNARYLINRDNLPPKYRPKKLRIIVVKKEVKNELI